MTALPKIRMSVDEFLAWHERQPGRYELKNGIVYAMSPEGAGHAKVKFAVQTALVAGIRARDLPCHMLPDGMTVRVDDTTQGIAQTLEIIDSQGVATRLRFCAAPSADMLDGVAPGELSTANAVQKVPGYAPPSIKRL